MTRESIASTCRIWFQPAWLLKLWLPVAGVLLAGGLSWWLGLWDGLTVETLRLHYGETRRWVAAHAVLAPMGFMLGYFVLAATGFPGNILLTLAGGDLFGWLPSALMSATAGTLASVMMYLLAKGPLRGWLARYVSLRKVERLLRHARWPALLGMRVMPLFPLVVLNVAMAVLGVGLRKFTLMAFVGMLPSCLLLAWAGDGLGRMLKRPEFEVSTLVAPLTWALFGLSVLALLPTLVRGGRAWMRG